MCATGPVLVTSKVSFAGGRVLGPPTQVPPMHESVVHGLPSSHGLALFGVKTHPEPALHESSVQGLWSSQTIEVWTQVPAVGQIVLQESAVQALTSSQLGDGPPTQEPLLQVSFVVQTLPSSQGFV